ncbi:long-chain fatty acid--CoA ligase [Mumia zhuanghuii]|uniref:Acyl-CoA synthetase n=2 Tax=Mumia TaxID=1546255 RepID=A0ABW1QL38_9ACTN|nr:MULTISPECIES: long-chain fatty acid--CoA ligase [Mumia]KAA1423662.1 long-chain fatty acid--CoA ligase [Mumia zhuanghuii]
MANAPTPEQLQTIESRAKNVGEMFFARVRETPNREAYRYPVGENWRSLTWGETGSVVSRIAAGLISLGIEPEERVAIASGTRYEWILADLGIMAASGATTTVYPTTVTDDVAYILADSASRVVFAEDATQLAKLQEKRSELPEVIKVVLFDGEDDSDWVITLAELEQLGEKVLAEQPTIIEDRVAATPPEQLATLIYTSGTTGRPKGVRLTHDSWTYEGAAVAAGGYITIDDLQYLWLPMAHSFGKVLLSTQLQVGFATAVDGTIPKIVDNLAVVKPTFMGAAPRIFEKAYGRIVGMMEEEGGVKLKLFTWATKVAGQVKALEREGKKVPAGLAFQYKLGDKIVLSKVRERFGGRVRFFISGASALSQEVAEWFEAAGILILEGYGLTESAAGSFVNHPDEYKLGTVGLPMPGTEVKIAEDGEILIKGPGVMQGYHNLESESASTITEDGWLATGDIGQIDEDGYLKITDRKKDLFKTSGGKYVAPSHVEGIFKGVCPLASQMIVHGNNRNFVTALITIDPDAAALFAEGHGLSGKSYAEIVTSPEMQKAIAGYVDELNSKLNRWETVKKWKVLDRDLSVEEGEITPSLKLKRKFVEGKYAAILDEFYAGA